MKIIGVSKVYYIAGCKDVGIVRSRAEWSAPLCMENIKD